MAGVGTGSLGRDVGLSRWAVSTGLGKQCNDCNCSSATNMMGPQMGIYASDVTEAELPHDDAGKIEYFEGGGHAPGGGVQVWACSGDSGGSVLAGAGAIGPTGSATAFPPPASGLWGVVAVIEGSYTYYDSSIDGGARPGTSVTPTWGFDNTQFLLAALPDSDGDGIPDPVEADSDGDGVIDDNDGCPCGPNEDDPWSTVGLSDGDGICQQCGTSDADTTGFCAGWCATHPVDLCPRVYSPNQEANCNADAERARNATVLPDACDPVPCPRFTFQPTQSGIELPVEHGFDSEGEWWTYSVQARYDALALRPVGTHYATPWVTGKLLDGDPKLVDIAVPVDSTEYRGCVSVGTLNIKCDRSDYVLDALLRDPPRRELEAKETAWHRVYIEELPPPPPPPTYPDNPLDVPITYKDGTTITRGWNWPQDYAYWHTRWPGFYPDVPTTPGQGAGRFWVHANTDVGMMVTNPYGTGFHPNASYAGSPQDGLANHYEYSAPVRARTVKTIHMKRLPVPRLPETEPACLIARLCTSCPQQQLPPEVEECGVCGAIVHAPDMSRFEAQAVCAVSTGTQTHFGVLLHDGRLASVDGKLGTRLQADLASDLVWANAAEPTPLAGKGASGPAAVALSADGIELANKAYVGSHRVLAEQDLCRPTDTGDCAPLPIKASSPQSEGEGSGPAPRTGFRAVYSRSLDRVFVVGGLDPATKEPRGDVWWRYASEGAWVKVRV
jgi:hypothetical protein